jgi:hypothetical protein
MILEFWHFETLIIELRIWGLIDDDSVECRGVFIVLFSGVSTVAVLFHSCLACVSIGWRSGDRKLLLFLGVEEKREWGVLFSDFWSEKQWMSEA